MSLQQFAKRLEKLGCTTVVNATDIEVNIGECEITIEFEKDWLSAIRDFYRARQYKYDSERRVLVANRSAEFQLTRLDPSYFLRTEHTFTDKKQNEVFLGPATKEFLLSYFESDRYSATFERIRDRIKRKCERHNRRKTPSRRVPLRPSELMWTLTTARYVAKRKPRNVAIDTIAIDRVRACLFSLAYQKNECWELTHDIKSHGFVAPQLADDDERLDIPEASYNTSVVSHYKVAKSSQFPSQVFLSYYHVLEYHFLRVADETLFGAVCSRLNDPAFQATYESVSKLVATIKKNDSTTDEKQMLRDVLLKFVPEEDFIEFIHICEDKRGEKIYSGTKQEVFGEHLSIKLEKGHALANATALLKHIRNALVHSSDRYSRGDCFLPFSESEAIVVKYLPLVQYLAEKVIFATAG